MAIPTRTGARYPGRARTDYELLFPRRCMPDYCNGFASPYIGLAPDGALRLSRRLPFIGGYGSEVVFDVGLSGGRVAVEGAEIVIRAGVL